MTKLDGTTAERLRVEWEADAVMIFAVYEEGTHNASSGQIDPQDAGHAKDSIILALESITTK